MNRKPPRHYLAQLFMTFISLLGWIMAGFTLFHMPAFGQPFELLFLTAFLFICEFYPMPFRKGNSSLSFPVIYVMYIVYGIEITVVLYFLCVLLTALLNRRPLRILFFNPAQLSLSLVTAHVLTQGMMPENAAVGLSFLLFIVSYFVINNLIVDFVLLIRPERYTGSMWTEKAKGELFSFSVSLIYGFLLHFLGSQNRGQIDVFTYFFFLSPLLFLAIISSIIIRLRADKQRLKALFHFSSELNKTIPVKDWEDEIKRLISEVVSYNESFLFTHEDSAWKLAVAEGSLSAKPSGFDELNRIRQTTVFNKKELKQAPLSGYFNENIQSAVFAPLILEKKTIGCLVMTKTRTNSFVEEDVQSIATIANQLAIFLQTQMLFSEKEQRVLLEERNRIAHDIHDGIAQTLAGAVMKLDTAAKKIPTHPQDAQALVNSSNNTLREGLKEVRDSIYALRPYPTEQVGLHGAIKKKIADVSASHGSAFNLSFETKGSQIRLNLLTEKIIFSVVQEGIHNCIKHANATKLDIVLSYEHDEVILTVKDDGVGFSLYEAMTAAMREPHYGILQMNEDAAKIGATLQIESRENAGTEIELRIPKPEFEGDEAIDRRTVGR